MKIQRRQIGQAIIVDISGILDTGTSTEALEIILGYVDEGHKKMIINLAETEYMSSSGLRILLASAKKLWAIEGVLKICHPNKVVKDILDTSGFSVIMDVVDTEEQALSEM